MSSDKDSKRAYLNRLESEGSLEAINDFARIITIGDIDSEADMKVGNAGPKSPYLRGMGLDLSFTSSNSAKQDEDKNSNGVQEESVLVVFDLPDGSQGESKFKLGQTVEVLKSFIESEYGIPMMDQVLYLETGVGQPKVMMDPFSLLDFPEAKGLPELFVRVEGILPSDSKK